MLSTVPQLCGTGVHAGGVRHRGADGRSVRRRRARPPASIRSRVARWRGAPRALTRGSSPGSVSSVLLRQRVSIQTLTRGHHGPFHMRWFAPAALLAAALAAQAQTARPGARPDPLDPKASVPALIYESSLATHRRLADEKPVSWREANDTVTRIGGWRVYARETRLPNPRRPRKRSSRHRRPAAEDTMTATRISPSGAKAPRNVALRCWPPCLSAPCCWAAARPSAPTAASAPSSRPPRSASARTCAGRAPTPTRTRIDQRVAELLAKPLTVDDAVQVALLNNRGLQADLPGARHHRGRAGAGRPPAQPGLQLRPPDARRRDRDRARPALQPGAPARAAAASARWRRAASSRPRRMVAMQRAVAGRRHAQGLRQRAWPPKRRVRYMRPGEAGRRCRAPNWRAAWRRSATSTSCSRRASRASTPTRRSTWRAPSRRSARRASG